jgi:hypothetical protein
MGVFFRFVHSLGFGRISKGLDFLGYQFVKEKITVSNEH